MTKEHVRPFGSKTPRGRGGPRGKKRSPRSKSRITAQPFLVTVVVWALVITSLQSIHGSHRSPPRPVKNIKSLSLSVAAPSSQTARRHLNFQFQAHLLPIIAPWQGPIQPVDIKPSALAPVFLRIPTSEPVVFLGIDDGWIKTPRMQNWLIRNRLPFSLFLTDNGIKNDYGYFKRLQIAGMDIENHTLSHPDLTKMTAKQQKREICGAADVFQSIYGRRPTLLRPPYGLFNRITKKMAARCGMEAIIMWHAFVDDGAVHFQDENKHLQPGDIVLMHFEKDFQHDMEAFTRQVVADHLQIGRLEDWIP